MSDFYISDYMKEYVESEENIQLIDAEDYFRLFKQLIPDRRRELAELFYHIGINPLYHMETVPSCYLEDSENITDIIIPEGVKLIEADAFNAASISEFKLPSSMMDVRTRAFSHSDVKYIDFGGTKFIGDVVCFACTDLSEVIMSQVKSIGPGAFRHCILLEHVHIPSTTVLIGSKAFGDSGLKEITYDGTIEDFQHIKISEFAIPEGTLIKCSDIDFIYSEAMR